MQNGSYSFVSHLLSTFMQSVVVTELARCDVQVLVWDLRDYDSGSLLKGGLQSQNEQNPTLREKVKLAVRCNLLRTVMGTV